jgi:aminopeptidase-like protein
LAQNEANLSTIKGGIVASLLGDGAPFHFKKSRQGNSSLDQVVSHVLEESGHPFEILDFTPYGYDERQFCSPGINLAVGNLTRSRYGYFEYHTSADDLQFISAAELSRSMEMYQRIVKVWDQNSSYLNLYPKGEPQLGRRGLYHAIGGENDKDQLQMSLLWVLNYSDGLHSLLDIAHLSELTFDIILKAASLLEEHQIIHKVDSKP